MKENMPDSFGVLRFRDQAAEVLRIQDMHVPPSKEARPRKE
jgi:hypothetical protein